MKFSSFLFPKIIKNELFLAIFISIATYLIFIGKFLLPNYYFWGSDATNFYYPTRVYFYERIFEEKSFPFWTEKLFMGFPVYVDAETGFLNPINILSILIFGPELSYKILHFVFYFIGSLSLYFILKRKNVELIGFSVANLIFYFSTYLLNHQIHFNIILLFYLFPTGIFLIEKYIGKTKLKYLIFLSIIISFGILYGHFQSVFIFCLGIGLYYLIYNFKKLFSFQTLFLAVSLFFLLLIQTLPQILPILEAYPNSVREENINLYKGSYVPVMTSFVFLPYMFGEIENYFGDKIKTDFSYTETYIYLGLSTFLVFVFCLLFVKTDKEILFAYLSFWLFLIFSILKYNNFFNEETPVVSLFRYWERIVIIPLFAISIIVGKFLEGKYELGMNNFFKKIWLVLIPIFYVFFYQFTTNRNLEVVKNVEKILSLSSIINYKYFNQLILILFLCLVLGFLLFLSKKIKQLNKFKNYILYGLAITIFCDIYYFSFDVVNFRLQDISDYKKRDFEFNNENQRSIIVNYKIKSLEYLYPNSWSLFGDSQFIENEYKEYLIKNGFIDIHGRVGEIKDFKRLEKFGITKVFIFQDNKLERIKDVSYKSLDLIQNESEDITYITKKPGNIVLKTNLNNEKDILTRLKYSPNWEVKVNKKPVEIIKNEIFLEFKLPQGENIIEISYVPKSFYLGIKISLFLTGIYLTILYFLNKQNYIQIYKKRF